MYPDVLHYWTCFACRDNIEPVERQFQFVIFKDGTIYALRFLGAVWEKFVLPEEKVKID
jgi:hypothetical protein